MEEEYNEVERRNRRRRMQHRLEEEEDDVYGAVRSDSKRDSSKEQSGQMCTRCEEDRADNICERCHTGYC